MKKNMILHLIAILVFMPLVVFAGNQLAEDSVETINYFKIAWSFAVFTFSGMLLSAINHILAATFKWAPFWKDTLKPAVWAYLAGLGLIALDIYLPQIDVFIESVVGKTSYLDFSSMALASIILVAFIKGLLKIKKTKAKVLKSSI